MTALPFDDPRATVRAMAAAAAHGVAAAVILALQVAGQEVGAAGATPFLLAITILAVDPLVLAWDAWDGLLPDVPGRIGRRALVLGAALACSWWYGAGVSSLALPLGFLLAPPVALGAIAWRAGAARRRPGALLYLAVATIAFVMGVAVFAVATVD